LFLKIQEVDCGFYLSKRRLVSSEQHGWKEEKKQRWSWGVFWIEGELRVWLRCEFGF